MPTTTATLMPDFAAKESLRTKDTNSAHLCPSVPRNLKFYTAWTCIPSCVSMMYRTEERKWAEARDGSIPRYLGCSIANGRMAKKNGMRNATKKRRLFIQTQQGRCLKIHSVETAFALSPALPTCPTYKLETISKPDLHTANCRECSAWQSDFEDVSMMLAKNVQTWQLEVIDCMSHEAKKTHRNLHIIYLYHSTVQIQIMQRKWSQTSGWPAWTGVETNGMSCRSDLSWCSNDTKVIVLLRASNAGAVTAANAINWLR